MGPNKYIHLTFAIGMLALSFLIYKTGDWIWSYFAKPNELAMQGGALICGVLGGIIAYRNERVFATAADVTKELEEGDLADQEGNLLRDGHCDRHGSYRNAHLVVLRLHLGVPRGQDPQVITDAIGRTL